MPDYLMLSYTANRNGRVAFEIMIVEGHTEDDAKEAVRKLVPILGLPMVMARQTRVNDPIPARFLNCPSPMGDDSITREMDVWAQGNPDRKSQSGITWTVIVQQRPAAPQQRDRRDAVMRAVERGLAPIAAEHRLRRPRRR